MSRRGDHDDLNSRQTKDNLRGAPSYRPSFNAYMWADAITDFLPTPNNRWTGTEWLDVSHVQKSPDQPLGGQWNEALKRRSCIDSASTTNA